MKTSLGEIQNTVLGSATSHSSWVYQQTQALKASAQTGLQKPTSI
jgi:hypothetical protein